MFDPAEQRFLSWFKSHGAELDPRVGLAPFEGMGRGAVALQNIAEGDTLFTIPRSLCLSTRTTGLAAALGEEAWAELDGEDAGWAPLILAMCWEDEQAGGKWREYFDLLPTEFTSLMFWSESDLSELRGSTVLDKIGKAEVERDWAERIHPFILAHSDFFAPPEKYSLEHYHIMGSRVLSRSFHVEEWKKEGEEDEDSDEEEEEQDGEDVGDVAMVPMADLLNAKSGCDNARLFYEEQCLRMVATQPIPAGSQIFNTYADPPNSDLLRRYGHVDYLPSSSDPEFLGNQHDLVEVRADLLLAHAMPGKSEEEREERVEFLLDEAGDDTFTLTHPEPLPELLLIAAQTFLLPPAAFQKSRGKSKLPKPVLDAPAARVLRDVLQARLGEYATALEDDLNALEAGPPPVHSGNQNKWNALVVRVGEKRILRRALEEVREALEELEAEEVEKGKDGDGDGKKGGKRKGEKWGAGGGVGKKTRVS